MNVLLICAIIAIQLINIDRIDTKIIDWSDLNRTSVSDQVFNH